MSTTYEIVIYGKVQHVGFRDRIEYIGKVLGIDGIVYNYKDGTVGFWLTLIQKEKRDYLKN